MKNGDYFSIQIEQSTLVITHGKDFYHIHSSNAVGITEFLMWWLQRKMMQ